MRRKVVQGLLEPRPDINARNPNRADVHGRRDETGRSDEGMKVQPGQDWPRGFKLAMIESVNKLPTGGVTRTTALRELRMICKATARPAGSMQRIQLPGQ